MCKKKDNQKLENEKKKEKKVLTPEQKIKRKKKKLVALSICFVLFMVLMINLVFLPLSAGNSRVNAVNSYTGENHYIKFQDRALISAHRAGGDLAPEETMMAFEKCMEPIDYKVDIVEFDLHITKDNKLVLLHDDTVDRTSNAVEYFGKKKNRVRERTLAELKELNFGENFVDVNGKTPYKGLRGKDIPDNIKILTLDEILTFLTSTRPNDLYYIIEIKDGGKDGELAMDILHDRMVKYGIVDKTIVGTFKDNVTKYIDKKYPELTRSASIMEVLNFYYSFLYGTKPNVNFEVLQIPASYAWFKLDTKAFIDYAHHYGVAVQYWTINNPKQAKELVNYGADAIITDNPEQIYKVI